MLSQLFPHLPHVYLLSFPNHFQGPFPTAWRSMCMHWTIKCRTGKEWCRYNIAGNDSDSTYYLHAANTQILLSSGQETTQRSQLPPASKCQQIKACSRVVAYIRMRQRRINGAAGSKEEAILNGARALMLLILKIFVSALRCTVASHQLEVITDFRKVCRHGPSMVQFHFSKMHNSPRKQSSVTYGQLDYTVPGNDH